MAIFKKKAESTDVAPAEVKTVAATSTTPKLGKSAGQVIVRPRITEKAALKSEVARAYTFEVTPKANKFSVAAAIKELYKVTPVKVNIVNLPSKNVVKRGKKGVKAGARKAYVYLKEGDKIEFV